MELPAAVAADVLRHIVGGQPPPDQVAAFQALHKVQLRAVEADQAACLRQLQADLAAAVEAGTHQPGILLTDLPAELLQHIVFGLPLAHHIARAAPTCRALSVAARNALKARVVTLRQHRPVPGVFAADGTVSSVATASNGRIITGAYDHTVKVWRDGVCERTVQAHTDWVRAVAVLPGGARFVTVSDDTTAKLWTIDGALERTFSLGGWAMCIAVLPDGVHFAVGNDRGDVKLHHVDGTLVHTFQGHTDYVWAVAVTHDGQHIISGSFDHTVKVWSAESKSLLSTCRGHTDYVFVVAAMPDGQRILSGARDKTIRVWQLDGTLENTFELHTNTECSSLFALVAMPDNQHALTGLHDIKLFDVNDGAVLRTFAHHDAAGAVSAGLRWHAVYSLSLLPDGLRFVSVSNDGTARIAYHGLAP